MFVCAGCAGVASVKETCVPVFLQHTSLCIALLHTSIHNDVCSYFFTKTNQEHTSVKKQEHTSLCIEVYSSAIHIFFFLEHTSLCIKVYGSVWQCVSEIYRDNGYVCACSVCAVVMCRR